MKQKKHVAILMQGPVVWNRWRQENGSIRNPDLADTKIPPMDLKGANLIRANFRDSDLSGVDLTGANLSKSYLIRTKFVRARLDEANLADADMEGADLTRASLVNSNLERAWLRNADLSNALMSRVRLVGADLLNARLAFADLSGANADGAWFVATNLLNAKMAGASLIEANCGGALLRGADLSGAILTSTCFNKADLTETDFGGADLRTASLEMAQLVRTQLSNADLTASRIFGISAWDVNLANAKQEDLVITPKGDPVITTDNMEIAQFIYLLLNNARVRNVLDAISTKVVLILGRFTSDRKVVLDTIRGELRKRNLIPVLFDFDKPANRDITETVSTLAHLARFVIADITDARSIPQELERIVPGLPSVPVQPLILDSDREYGMFEHFVRYPWVLPLYRYKDVSGIVAELSEKIIDPAEAKARELTKR